MSDAKRFFRVLFDIESRSLWEGTFLPDEVWIQNIVSVVFQETAFDLPCEISFLWGDNRSIQSFNRLYRQIDRPTNVLAFSQFDPSELWDIPPSPAVAPQQHKTHHPSVVPLPIGDVMFAHETIAMEATQQEKSFKNHLIHLIVHGLLHLLGYDHQKEQEAHHMEHMEITILKMLGLGNPYQ